MSSVASFTVFSLTSPSQALKGLQAIVAVNILKKVSLLLIPLATPGARSISSRDGQPGRDVGTAVFHIRRVTLFGNMCIEGDQTFAGVAVSL
eukprot:731761-Hanusia_phi.AAC.1